MQTHCPPQPPALCLLAPLSIPIYSLLVVSGLNGKPRVVEHLTEHGVPSGLYARYRKQYVWTLQWLGRGTPQRAWVRAQNGERDLIRFDEQGLIVDFEVMVRPFNGLQALGDEMGRRVAGALPTWPR